MSSRYTRSFNPAGFKAGDNGEGDSARRAQIVTHFIAGYPDWEASLNVARGLIAGGAYALEMQIPFSDPSADGPVIEAACREALAAGFRVQDAWKLLEAIRAESDIPVFVMSYASLVLRPGVAEFVRQAQGAGASGLIIPDLVPGADEGLFEIAAEAACPAVPVLVPWISDARLDEILDERIDWVYVALRSGITGSYTELDNRQAAFLAKLKDRGQSRSSLEGDGNGQPARPGDNSRSLASPAGHGNLSSAGLRVMAGFGIQNVAQVRTLTALSDAAVVGSALVRVISEAWDAGIRAGDLSKKITALVEELRGV